MRSNTTDSLVNIRVLVVADRYLDSAKILIKHPDRQVLASFVLAALAVEIYLKSLLLKIEKSLLEEINLPDDQGTAFSYEYVISNGIREHKLTKLYALVKKQNIAPLLLDAMSIEENDLLQMLSEFENYFTGLRYHYEDSAKFSANSGILDLAESLKKACHEIMKNSSI